MLEGWYHTIWILSSASSFVLLLLYTHVLVQIPYDLNHIIAFKIVTPVFF